LQVGDVNFGVDRDWCGWDSDRLCDIGGRPFSVDLNVQEWKVAFFFFHCELYLVVESIEVVQKFCQFFYAMGPIDESVVYISEPVYSGAPIFEIRLGDKLLIN
jgi:hypothetical protein